jgi:hypothetical protein
MPRRRCVDRPAKIALAAMPGFKNLEYREHLGSFLRSSRLPADVLSTTREAEAQAAGTSGAHNSARSAGGAGLGKPCRSPLSLGSLATRCTLSQEADCSRDPPTIARSVPLGRQ